MGFLCAKAELLKIIQSIRGTDRASHTKKECVKDNSLGLQASPPIGGQAVYLHSIYEVYLPLADIRLVSSAYISARLS